MAYDTSQTSSHPTLASLQDQLRKLLPGRPAVTQPTQAAQAVPRLDLARLAMDNAPLLLELFDAIMAKVRHRAPSLPPLPQLSVPQLPAPRRRRKGLLRPVLIAVSVAGAGYLVSRMVLPGTRRDAPPGR